MEILLIGNPAAGGGRARRKIDALGRVLAARGHAVDAFVTGRAGDAEARAAALSPRIERLVVVGGDGTLNEVVNGLAAPGRVPLAQLPCGTANLLAHDLGLPRRPERAAELVERGRVLRVDAGLANGRRFLGVVSSGFDAMVVHAMRARRKRLSYASYLPSLLRLLRGYVPPRLSVVIDGAAPEPCGLVIASNTRNYGGLFTVAPDARPDSGRLDACLFTRAERRRLLAIAARGLVGAVAGRLGVVHREARRLAIRSEVPIAVELDGDPFGSTPLDVEVAPGLVALLVPDREAGPAR